jgi:hypothetical protein
VLLLVIASLSLAAICMYVGLADLDRALDSRKIHGGYPGFGYREVVLPDKPGRGTAQFVLGESADGPLADDPLVSTAVQASTVVSESLSTSDKQTEDAKQQTSEIRNQLEGFIAEENDGKTMPSPHRLAGDQKTELGDNQKFFVRDMALSISNLFSSSAESAQADNQPSDSEAHSAMAKQLLQQAAEQTPAAAEQSDENTAPQGGAEHPGQVQEVVQQVAEDTLTAAEQSGVSTIPQRGRDQPGEAELRPAVVEETEAKEVPASVPKTVSATDEESVRWANAAFNIAGAHQSAANRQRRFEDVMAVPPGEREAKYNQLAKGDSLMTLGTIRTSLMAMQVQLSGFGDKSVPAMKKVKHGLLDSIPKIEGIADYKLVTSSTADVHDVFDGLRVLAAARKDMVDNSQDDMLTSNQRKRNQLNFLQLFQVQLATFKSTLLPKVKRLRALANGLPAVTEPLAGGGAPEAALGVATEGVSGSISGDSRTPKYSVPDVELQNYIQEVPTAKSAVNTDTEQALLTQDSSQLKAGDPNPSPAVQGVDADTVQPPDMELQNYTQEVPAAKSDVITHTEQTLLAQDPAVGQLDAEDPNAAPAAKDAHVDSIQTAAVQEPGEMMSRTAFEPRSMELQSIDLTSKQEKFEKKYALAALALPDVDDSTRQAYYDRIMAAPVEERGGLYLQVKAEANQVKLKSRLQARAKEVTRSHYLLPFVSLSTSQKQSVTNDDDESFDDLFDEAEKETLDDEITEETEVSTLVDTEDDLVSIDEPAEHVSAPKFAALQHYDKLGPSYKPEQIAQETEATETPVKTKSTETESTETTESTESTEMETKSNSDGSESADTEPKNHSVTALAAPPAPVYRRATTPEQAAALQAATAEDAPLSADTIDTATETLDALGNVDEKKYEGQRYNVDRMTGQILSDDGAVIGKWAHGVAYGSCDGCRDPSHEKAKTTVASAAATVESVLEAGAQTETETTTTEEHDGASVTQDTLSGEDATNVGSTVEAETATTAGDSLLQSASNGVLDLLRGGDDETTTTMAATKGGSMAEAEAATTEGTSDPEGSGTTTEEDDGASVAKDTLSGEDATKGLGGAPGIEARLKTLAARIAEHSKQLADLAADKTVRPAFRPSPVMGCVAAAAVAAGKLEPNSLTSRFHRCRRLLLLPSLAGCATTFLSSRPSGGTRCSWIRRASK